MALYLDPGYGTENGPCAILTAINDNGVFLSTCGDVHYAAGYQVKNDACTQDRTFVSQQHISIGPGNAGVPSFLGYQSVLRLRGNGDIAAYGGSELSTVYGVARIGRNTGRDGRFEYVNSCDTLATAGSHQWYNQEVPANITQDLMELTPTVAQIFYVGGWTIVSDDRLKKNNRPLLKNDSTQKVKALIPQEYESIEHGGKFTGFVYSNVLQTMPEATSTIHRKIAMEGPGEGHTPVTMEIGAIRPNDILAVVTSAVQDLIDRVEALEAHGNSNGK